MRILIKSKVFRDRLNFRYFPHAPLVIEADGGAAGETT
jgi:hypothetical protein